MKPLVFQPATTADARYLMRNIRESDAREIAMSISKPVPEEIAYSLEHSEVAYSAKVDGKLLCILGVSRFSPLDEDGIVWELGTDHITEHLRSFLAAGKRALRLLADGCPGVRRLHNIMPESYTTYIRWAEKYLGATFDAEPIVFQNGARFVKFTIHLEDVLCAE